MSIHYSKEAKEAGWSDYPPAKQEREPMTNEEATIDIDAAQERVKTILGPLPTEYISIVQPTQPTHPPAPNRKPRSDKGVPKKLPADMDEIVLRMPLQEARDLALEIGLVFPNIAAKIQDQIIVHLQKRLDLLTKQK